MIYFNIYNNKKQKRKKPILKNIKVEYEIIKFTMILISV